MSNIFENCTNLERVILHEGVTELVYATFTGCSELTFVKLPDSLEKIGWAAFRDCSKLTTLNLNLSGNSQLVQIGGQAFASNDFTTLNLPATFRHLDNRNALASSSITTINIPASIFDASDFTHGGYDDNGNAYNELYNLKDDFGNSNQITTTVSGKSGVTIIKQ